MQSAILAVGYIPTVLLWHALPVTPELATSAVPDLNTVWMVNPGGGLEGVCPPPPHPSNPESIVIAARLIISNNTFSRVSALIRFIGPLPVSLSQGFLSLLPNGLQCSSAAVPLELHSGPPCFSPDL